MSMQGVLISVSGIVDDVLLAESTPTLEEFGTEAQKQVRLITSKNSVMFTNEHVDSLSCALLLIDGKFCT